MKNKRDFKEAIQAGLEKAGKKGLTARELCSRLRVGRRQKEQFFLLLYKLEKEGWLQKRQGRYRLIQPEKPFCGEIVAVKEGFGFARPDNGGQDYFIPGRALMGAMPGDRVQLSGLPSRGELPEARVVRILQESSRPFSGVLQRKNGRFYLLPDRQRRMPIQVLARRGASDGDKVLGRLSKRGDSHFEHRAEIMEVFGRADSAAACSEAILAACGITKDFSDEARRQAGLLQRRAIQSEEIQRRLDLRAACIFTIDGQDTKDIDDAVSLERTRDGWKLGVHIADVSYYVRDGSALDQEALERGTSVYYADTVVPMLPPALSNGICSLNPGEDRLAFSALLTLDQSGAIIGFQFCKSVICSRIKGVYSEINLLLEDKARPELMEKYQGLRQTLQDMAQLAKTLRLRRMSRGGVDLHSSESKILVGEDGRTREVTARASGAAEGMIEEFMLLANEAAATLAAQKGLPFLYRIHEDPPQEKIEGLRELLNLLGLGQENLNTQVSPMELTKILRTTKGTDLELIVNNQILRSMAKARYSEENKGHFGLALNNYTHFTSPIRRYPDLAVHRILGAWLEGLTPEQLQRRYSGFVKTAAEQASNREIRAMTAERECEACYKAEYMARHVAEEFDGTIISVMANGFYVELDNTVEGLVSIESLPQGNYAYDGWIRLEEQRSGVCYRVGMRVRVQVARADVSAGQVDFILAGQAGCPNRL